MTCVYVIEAAEVGRVKVGRAVNPWARTVDMQVCSPVRLKLFGAIQIASLKEASRVEARCQFRLRDLRVHGEWFELDAGAALQAVMEAARELGVVHQMWVRPAPSMSKSDRWLASHGANLSTG